MPWRVIFCGSSSCRKVISVATRGWTQDFRSFGKWFPRSPNAQGLGWSACCQAGPAIPMPFLIPWCDVRRLWDQHIPNTKRSKGCDTKRAKHLVNDRAQRQGHGEMYVWKVESCWNHLEGLKITKACTVHTSLLLMLVPAPRIETQPAEPTWNCYLTISAATMGIKCG
jgi:hypothetical protein